MPRTTSPRDACRSIDAALAIVRPQIEAGKIKLIAVTNTVRAPAQPDVPTVAEAGFPALTLDGLVGLFGPPGMPLELRERITADIRAVADSTVADRLTLTGQFLNIGGPEEFAKSIDEQRARSRPSPRISASSRCRQLKIPHQGVLTSVCTLMTICHWPLRFTQTRAA